MQLQLGNVDMCKIKCLFLQVVLKVNFTKYRTCAWVHGGSVMGMGIGIGTMVLWLALAVVLAFV